MGPRLPSEIAATTTRHHHHHHHKPQTAAAAMTPSSTSPSTAANNIARSSSHSASPAPRDPAVDNKTTASSSPPAGQKPLPTTNADAAQNAANNGTAAARVRPEGQPDAMDVDSNGTDGEDAESPNNGSDNQGSEDADGANGQRKKKSQKFYCTDYPPCNLSFTRSEHLARHIRKHTGERPFQCHCARRFSRLDNLRQHAQTVHLNEAIPADSPAAHGSRYQRQHRQERVRAAGNRARASTGGSAGGPVRGHSKSLSTSSINSMSSVGSAYSNAPPYSSQMDPRRRPPPLVMAGDPRMHGGVEYRPAEGVYYGPPSPEYSTPTSATFSTAQTSPTRWGPGMSSPTMGHSRSHSLYSVDEHTHQRRLSVPSGQNPFSQPGGGGGMSRPNFAPVVPSNGSPSTTFSPTNSSYMASPSSSAWPARRDSVSSSNADESWRRRTWHSDSRNADPRAPNPPPPIAEPPSTPQSNVRLPAINAAFGPWLGGEQGPPNSAIDPELTPRRVPPSIEPSPMERPRNANLYEPNLQRGLNRLDMAHSPAPSQSPANWGPDPRDPRDEVNDRSYTPSVRFQEGPPPSSSAGPTRASRSLHQYTMSAPSSARDTRRHGWYPQPNEHDQRAARVERMEHPNMNAFRGFPQREAEVQERREERGGDGRPDPLGRLEALVAVATSEGSTAAAY